MLLKMIEDDKSFYLCVLHLSINTISEIKMEKN